MKHIVPGFPWEQGKGPFWVRAGNTFDIFCACSSQRFQMKCLVDFLHMNQLSPLSTLCNESEGKKSKSKSKTNVNVPVFQKRYWNQNVVKIE